MRKVTNAQEIEQAEELLKQYGQNKPLTHAEVRELKPMRAANEMDKKGNVKLGKPMLCHQHQGMNRAQRRAEKAPLYGRSRNRKNTKGRKSEVVDVTYVEKKTKYGNITATTGYKKKINHKPVEVKKWKYITSVRQKKEGE